MQRMIRELGEEVETHQQTTLSLKDEHAAELQKVRDEHAAELTKTEEEHAAELKKTKECDEIVKGVREKEIARLELEVECLGNENKALKKKMGDAKEWGVGRIESMGYALEDMMFELEKRMADDKN